MSAHAASLPHRFARLVRFEHTIFALPFAYVGALLSVDGWPGWETMAWVTVAMVGARTLAMSLNRLVDAELDARNPRTATRELPAGTLTRVQVWVLCAAALAAYLVAVFQLDPIVRWLWPIPWPSSPSTRTSSGSRGSATSGLARVSVSRRREPGSR